MRDVVDVAVKDSFTCFLLLAGDYFTPCKIWALEIYIHTVEERWDKKKKLRGLEKFANHKTIRSTTNEVIYLPSVRIFL